MHQYLSVSDVAARLGVSVNTINSRIRSGDFPDPDAMIGARYQGWTVATIDNLLADDHTGGVISWNFDVAARLINELREIAELVSAYSGPGHTSVDTVFEINSIALATESMARTVWRSRAHAQQRIDAIAADGPVGPVATEMVELEGIRSAQLVIPPPECPADTAVGALNDAADRLDRVNTEFPDAYRGAQSKRIALRLTRAAAEVRQRAQERGTAAT